MFQLFYPQDFSIFQLFYPQEFFSFLQFYPQEFSSIPLESFLMYTGFHWKIHEISLALLMKSKIIKKNEIL